MNESRKSNKLPFQSFAAAFHLLTILRIPVKTDTSSGTLAASVGWFPTVGLFLGCVLAAVYFCSNLVFPGVISSLLVVLVISLLTRALHLDGLADTVDGLGGAYNAKVRLEIMKDSHIGTFGVIAIVFAVLFKAAAIWKLAPNLRLRVLIAFPVLGRFSMVYLARLGKYAREEGGLGQSYVDLVTGRTIIFASTSTLIIAFLALSWWGIILMAVVIAMATACNFFFSKTLGGITGDTLGATNELCEIVVLVLSLLAPHP